MLQELQGSKDCKNLLWPSNFGAFSLILLNLNSNFSKSIEDITSWKFSGLSNLIYYSNLANCYQILRWVMRVSWKVSCKIWIYISVYMQHLYRVLKTFPGPVETGISVVSWIGLQKFTNVIFRITQKPLCFKSLDLTL